MIAQHCTKCGKLMIRAVMQWHPTRDDLMLFTFECWPCGAFRTIAYPIMIAPEAVPIIPQIGTGGGQPPLL